MATDTNYLVYLDKEMTIMGILSTFCVAVVALVLDRTCGAEPSKQTVFSVLWSQERLYVLLGSIFFGLGASLFYMQRSALAWFYGQIALSMDMPAIGGRSVQEWHEDADSWATWNPYQGAFTAVGIGSSMYLVALLEGSGTLHISTWLVWAGVAVTLIVQSVRMAIFRRYKYDDDPIGKVIPLMKRR